MVWRESLSVRDARLVYPGQSNIQYTVVRRYYTFLVRPPFFEVLYFALALVLLAKGTQTRRIDTAQIIILTDNCEVRRVRLRNNNILSMRVWLLIRS